MNRLERGLRQRDKTRLIFLSDRDGQGGADGGFVGVLPTCTMAATVSASALR